MYFTTPLMAWYDLSRHKTQSHGASQDLAKQVLEAKNMMTCHFQ